MQFLSHWESLIVIFLTDDIKIGIFSHRELSTEANRLSSFFLTRKHRMPF